MKFNGQAWELFGDVITGEVGHEWAIELIPKSGYRFSEKVML